MTERSKDGRETWRRLLAWDRGQASAERLAGHILRVEGFASIDPSHPLGGPDGLKDIVCTREGKKWIGAAYFPRGQHSLVQISEKLKNDIEGIAKNSVDGLAFVTNQELRLRERDELVESAAPHRVEILHLERIASVLDSAQCYGIRLEFLDIEMTKEEQLAFLAQRDLVLADMKGTLDAVLKAVSAKRGTREDADIPVVSPRNFGGTYATTSLFSQKPHECKSCHAVILVNRSGLMTTAMSVYNMMVITCPYCGRSERFNPWAP